MKTFAWKSRLRYGAAAALAALLLAGCQSTPTRDPDFANVRPAVPRQVQPTAGAIYASNTYITLFEDLRARRVGDILTIVLEESTSASKSADTTHDKSNQTTITNPTILGAPVSFSVPSALPLASVPNNSFETDLRSSSEFQGDSESNQSNELTGEVTVSVAEVLPNGNLVIQGEKLFTLNQGHEHIRFSGIVRPYDINADNKVMSTKVANARIVYAGEGPAHDANAMGWLARFFMSPIFPF